MKKLIFLLLVISLLVPSAVFADDEEMAKALQTRVDELKNKVDELSAKIDTLITLFTPSEIEENITIGTGIKFDNGTYLVPDDLKLGIWSFAVNNPEEECYIRTYSEISTSFTHLIDQQLLAQGYFTVDNRVKFVEVDSSYGTKCEITFYKDL